MNDYLTVTKKLFINTAKFIILIVAFFIASVLSAHAMPSLQLSDGSTTILIVDEGPGDALPGIIGGVGYLGSVGVFNLTVTTGFVTPLIGTSELPMLNLNSVGVSSSGSGGTLTIMFTETGFGSIAAPLFETKVGGTNRGAVSFNTYVDNTNTAFGTGTLIGNLGATSSGAFSGSTSAIFNPSDPFSMTAVATITHGSGKKASSFGLSVNVAPEPISYALFIIGGALLGSRHYLTRKKRQVL
jgi:hypothetical protein